MGKPACMLCDTTEGYIYIVDRPKDTILACESCLSKPEEERNVMKEYVDIIMAHYKDKDEEWAYSQLVRVINNTDAELDHRVMGELLAREFDISQEELA